MENFPSDLVAYIDSLICVAKTEESKFLLNQVKTVAVGMGNFHSHRFNIGEWVWVVKCRTKFYKKINDAMGLPCNYNTYEIIKGNNHIKDKIEWFNLGDDQSKDQYNKSIEFKLKTKAYTVKDKEFGVDYCFKTKDEAMKWIDAMGAVKYIK